MTDIFDEIAATHGLSPISPAHTAAQDELPRMSRRGALIGGICTGGAFWLGWIPSIQAQTPSPPQGTAGATVGAGGTTIVNPEAYNAMAWLTIEADNTVRIMVAKSEMGQGVLTSLPMIIADELDADWSRVKTEHAPLGRAFDDPRANARDTGGSRSVRLSYELMRTIGASAREMLVSAAATQWSVDAAQCMTRDSFVVHPSSGRRLAYAAVAVAAAKLEVPAKPKLKDPSEFRIIGQSLPRVDIPDKVTGKTTYTSDLRLPGMLVATLVQSPVFGGKVATVDDAAARAIKGVHSVVRFDDWVGVIADTFWHALQGARALKITWNEGDFAAVSQADINKRFADAAQTPGVRVRTEGDAAQALAAAVKRIDAVYEVPYLAQTPMEPLSCVAQIEGGRCKLWAGTQRQSHTAQRVAQTLGINAADIDIQTMQMGGGLGRRFSEDFVLQAALLARTTQGRPVKLLWTREEDVQHAFYRPATYNRFVGGLDDKGQPLAWTHKIVGQAVLKAFRPELVRNGLDPTSVEGASNMPYSIANIAVDYVMQDLPVPVGPWRSVGSSQNAFVTEGFVDELAHAAGRDPLEFRKGLLGRHPRHLAVLGLLAERGGWSKPLPTGTGRGVAVAECFGGWCAQMAEVRALPDGKIRVERIVAVIDCGRAVNPRGVREQLESAIVYALSATLSGEIIIDKGRVAQSNFHNYSALRINEIPKLELHIVPSTAVPGGVGEVGTPPTAPAVVNAVFAATGKRIRSLPLSRHNLV
jgi:isoquinoline 1-oxidoreductase subunit beta